MHARLTTAAIGHDETDSVVEIFEQVVPTFRELEGYAGMIVLSSSERELLVLTLWDSAEAMAASEAVAQKVSAAETAQRDFEVEKTSRYRVVTFDLAK
jgi:heme-degrading monooxygenase HmoA